MPLRLEYQHKNKSEYNEQQQKYAFPPSSVFLVSRSLLEFLDRITHPHSGLLDIILHTIQERALIDDKDRKIFEQLGK